VAATLDPGNKSANIALSGGNLVATSSGAGAVRSTRALQGLTYFEAVITTLTGTPAIGVCNQGFVTTNSLGADANSIGYIPSGVVRDNTGTLIATIQAYVQGDRVDCAVDPGSRLIWFRTNGGNWNNSGTANPATGAGGIDFSGWLNLGTLYAAFSASATGTVWTSKFSTPFTGAAPAGYSSLDLVLYTLARNVDVFYGGNPSVAQQFSPAARALPLPLDKYERAFSPAGPITVVSGFVKEYGIAVAGRQVDVYDRRSGELLGTTKSAGDGSWSVPVLGRVAVRIVGSDPTTFNSLVYDNVVPL
jgi:hypothetical protein